MQHADLIKRARGRPGRSIAHRRRFVAPLLAGREVLELTPGESVPRPHDSEIGTIGVAVVMQLEPIAASRVAARAGAMLKLVSEFGIVVISSDAQLPGATLCGIAPHFAHYLQNDISGSLFRAQAFDTSRIAVLRDTPRADRVVHLYLFAQRSLPALSPGLLAHAGSRPAEEKLDVPLDAPAPAPVLQISRAGSGGAAALARRLLAQESVKLELWRALRRAEHEHAQPRLSSAGDNFTPPPGRHPWRLAESPVSALASADPYDRRVDDPAIIEARAGGAFFAAHDLDKDSPDFASATAELVSTPNRLAAPVGALPDVSIVIPVYGQLAYTLNCLHSLFSQTARFTAEIIVVDDCSPDSTGEYLPRLKQLRYHRQLQNGGFIASCNAGAALARGSFVLMLNNDTRVASGWLDALIGSFQAFPKAGLVGSKMLYPDGTLQEAGGIIWRDGTAWNYGREDDPNRPHYAYARQVDYVSGCSIALLRADWEALGGFDTHYHPAYCEDADLCLRMAQLGKEVWFQPQSRVIHYEGRTSGMDVSSGPKAHQVRNLKKLFLRWRDTLASHRPSGLDPYFEKDRSVRKRMLVIDATTPTPDQDAGSLQTVLILQSCRALGYATTFVAKENFLFQPGYTTDLQAAGIECAYAPYEAVDIELYLRRYGRLFDAVMVFRMTVLEDVLPLLRRHVPDAVTLFHVADLHFLRVQRQAALDNDETLAVEAASVRERELALVLGADCTITHSHFEADLLAEVVPEAPTVVWPLMHPFHGTEVGFEDRRDVVFLGGYRHPPNVDAAEHFAADILPRLHKAEAELRFIAAGANPTPEIAALAGKTVVVTGQVPDLRDVFDTARVFVCPLRVGAGMKGKILSAMSYGLPVVSTSVGIEGTGFQPELHLLVADDAATFARQVLRLYRDAELWNRLSRAGQDFIRSEYAPEGGAVYLTKAIEQAWAKKLGVED